MKYLLDTNVISELKKPNCNQNVRLFVQEVAGNDLFISAITMGELYYGIEKLPAGKKKHNLCVWLYSKVGEWFDRRIVPLDTETMLEWGKIRANAENTLPVIDSLIAASAIVNHMFLVTRNTKDFENIEGINLLNPWEF